MDWMLVSPQIHVLIDLTHNVMIFGDEAFVKWWSHNIGALINGISAHIRPPREFPCPFHHVRTQWDDNCLWTRKQVLTRHWICGCLSFGLPSRTMKNKFLLLISHSAVCMQRGRPRFSPWVGKIPWRREQLPIPVVYLREFHGLYSPWGGNESDTTEQLSLSHKPLGLWYSILLA